MRVLMALTVTALLLQAWLSPSVVQAQSAANYALRFYGHGSGNIDRLRVPVDPQTAADVGQDFTLEFWIRALPGENNGVATCNAKDGWITGNILFDRDIFGSPDYGDWGISLSNGRIAFGITRGNLGTTLCGRANVADGVWHHVAVVRRASDGLMRIFVDGWLDAQRYGPKGNISYRDGRSTSYENDPYLVIGAEKHDAGPEFPSFSGWLDEIRLSTVIRYDRAFDLPLQPFNPDQYTAFLYHFDEAAAEGPCNATIPDAAGRVNAECLYGGDAPAGPVYSSSTPFVATQRMAIPSYFGTESLWNQAITAAPTVGILILNPEDGPGSAPDATYQTLVTQAQSNGILVLGYVFTSYGKRSALLVKRDVQRYFSWYRVNGIFLDETPVSCTRQPYYLDLYRYVKSQRPGARVVINPGTTPAECYIKAADVILNFEDSYSEYQNWMPDSWVYKYPAQRFWHLIIGADQSQMQQAVQQSKARHAGWVYVTDDDLPNPWDSLPADPYWTEEINAIRAPFWSADFRKGVSFAAWWQNQYTSPSADQVLTRLLPADGVEWISLIVTCYQPNLSATTIDCTSLRTPTDSELIHVIQQAHAQGMKVMLKPHVDLDSGSWRGQIDFGNDETAWSQWFASYTSFITHYASLAQSQNVELFAVGTELVGTTRRESDWRGVIAAVRGVYSGPITYAANHSGEEISIQWWDAVDFIGVDAYYPLTSSTNPRPEQLRAALIPVANTLSTLASTWNKPILLTEIGYRSVDGANREPWNWSRPGVVDLQEQNLCYQAALDVFSVQPWLKGIFWWVWQPDDPLRAPNNTGYSVYRKPAEWTMRAFYLLP